MSEQPPSYGGPPFGRPDDDPAQPADAEQAAPGRLETPADPSSGPPALPEEPFDHPPLHDDWSPGHVPSDVWSRAAPPQDAGVDSAPLYPTSWQETIATAPAGYQAGGEPRSVRRAAGRHLREIAETIILALLIFLVVRAVVQNFQVEGSSMQPTLQSSWYLLVNKAAYWEVNLDTLSKFVPFLEPGDDPTRYIFGGPDRGDVIVFVAPDTLPGQPERDFIKRIIGLPGETVEVKDCTVFVNGKPLDEPYILEQTNSTYGPEVVPPDHFFVLGDNRNNSRDSRASDIGMIPKESIIGKAWVTYWPFDALGIVSDTSVEPGAGSSASLTKSASTQGVAACAG